MSSNVCGKEGCSSPARQGWDLRLEWSLCPAFLTSCGAQITATDLSPDDERSRGWTSTGQHASNIEALWKPQIVTRKKFFENCSFEFVDMTMIPSKFDEQFDFCWSVCAFEHLGTLQKGLEFVLQATRTLKPGGFAVHTTEYNVADGETIDNWPTVLYQKKHFATLKTMIEDAGCILVDIDFDVGHELFDCYVDVPPFPHQDARGLAVPQAPQLKISVDGFPTTSIAIVVKKPLPAAAGKEGRNLSSAPSPNA